MRYEIARLVDACDQLVELSRAQFEDAWSAKKKLVLALDVEDKLELVLGNYAEFEQELLGLMVHFSLFTNFDWSSRMADFLTINRRLMNLLSACRLYVDQVKHVFGAIYGDTSVQYCQICNAFSTEYDAQIAYRVLDAIRNQAQHRMLPVHHLSYGWEMEGEAGNRRDKLILTPSLSVARIKEEGNFKASVLRELEHGDELVDLKPLVREYVASIGRVHQALRNLMKGDIDLWEGILAQVKERFRSVYGDNFIGLALVAKDENGEIVQSSDVFDDLIKRRKMLEAKNTKMDVYDKQYVSSEAHQAKP